MGIRSLLNERRERKVRRESARNLESVWRDLGIPEDAWPAIRQRWVSEPVLMSFMDGYAPGVVSPARLKRLALADDGPTALYRELALAVQEREVPFQEWCKQREKCPRCHGPGVHIMYGYIDGEMAEARRRGDIVVYGCLQQRDDKNWTCKRCLYKWRGPWR